MIKYQQNVQQYFHNILVRSFKFVHSILSCRQLWSKLKTSSNVTDTAMTDDKPINKTYNGNTIIMIVRCCRLLHVVLCVVSRDVCCQSETWQPTKPTAPDLSNECALKTLNFYHLVLFLTVVWTEPFVPVRTSQPGGKLHWTRAKETQRYPISPYGLITSLGLGGVLFRRRTGLCDICRQRLTCEGMCNFKRLI